MHIAWLPQHDCLNPVIYMIFHDGDTSWKHLSNQTWTSGPSEKEIWEAFPEINAKVKSVKQVQLRQKVLLI